MVAVTSRAVAGSPLVLTSTSTAAPRSIEAAAELGDLGLRVVLRIRVDPGGAPRIVRLEVTPLAATAAGIEMADGSGWLPPGAVTARSLRTIRLDELAREALRQQERPAVFQDTDAELLAFTSPGETGTTWARTPETRRPPHEQLVKQAAQIYAQAARAGSRSPTLAVVNALGYSRTQVSRFIREARRAGMIKG